MSNTPSSPRSFNPPPPPPMTFKKKVLSWLGWFAVGVFVLGAAWGAGKGEGSILPQVDIPIGMIQGHTAIPAMKTMSALFPQGKYVRKTRFRVSWEEMENGKVIPCALHYDRDEKTLDLYRDKVWIDGFNEVLDPEIIVASKSKEGFEKLADMGATRSPQPVKGKRQL